MKDWKDLDFRSSRWACRTNLPKSSLSTGSALEGTVVVDNVLTSLELPTIVLDSAAFATLAGNSNDVEDGV